LTKARSRLKIPRNKYEEDRMLALETKRLILRMFDKDDIDAYYNICANAETMRYIGEGQPLSRTDAWRQVAVFLGTWQLRGYGMWALEEKASGRMIGRVGYIHPEGWPGIELGWVLARPFWGRGMATEAATACLKHGFSAFGFTHIISLIHPDNHRSIAVAERIGESKQGNTELSGRPALIYGIRNKT
jgi:RimJ/RimL family protein N-acetyltransferase